MRGWLKRYWPYALVSIAVMGPLLAPGYVLTMDMVFVPHPPIPSELSASFPFYVLLHYVSYVIPGDVLQKLLLLSILLGAGTGMDRLLRQLFKSQLPAWAVVAASLFYMTSAFVYERMMMGQWAVVAGYALLPFVTVALLRFLDAPTWRQLWWLVAWALLLSLMSVHALVPFAIVAVLLIGTEWRRWREFIRKLGTGILVLLVASSYWLIPALLGSNTIGTALRGSVDTQAFASNGGLFSLLRLQGMWAEGYGLFRLPQELTILPGVWQTLAWIAIITGFVALWRRQRRIAVLGAALIVIGCLVALVGIGDTYREPHKIMVLTAVGMSILMAAGVNVWLRRVKRARPALMAPVGMFACLLPVVLGMAMLWGFSGQLSARSYPSEWYTLNQRLQRLPSDKPAIFVPWHLYQRYSFSPRIVANPASSFFEQQRIIVSNDPEFAGVQPLKGDDLTSKVDQLLKVRPSNVTSQLAQLGIGYIIFAEEPGYEEYEFIRHDDALRRVFSEGRLTLYEIKEASS